MSGPVVTDAINKAFDDQVSRLFARLCDAHAAAQGERSTEDADKQFRIDMLLALSARSAALETMRKHFRGDQP